jgi:hypothetical protein
MVNRFAGLRWLAAGCFFLGIDPLPAQSADEPVAGVPRQFAWKASHSLVSAKPLDGDEKHALKDPSIVYHDKRWHLFCTVRGQKRRHGIVYLNFADWQHASRVAQTMLPGPTHHRFSIIPSPRKISSRKLGSRAAAKRFLAMLSLHG